MIHDKLIAIIESRQRSPKAKLSIIAADKTKKWEIDYCAALHGHGYLDFIRNRVVAIHSKRDVGFIIYKISDKGYEAIKQLLADDRFTYDTQLKLNDRF